MSFDANAIASSQFAALLLSLAIIAGFITGHLVSGQLYRDLLTALHELTAAIEVRNRLDQDTLNRRGQ